MCHNLQERFEINPQEDNLARYSVILQDYYTGTQKIRKTGQSLDDRS